MRFVINKKYDLKKDCDKTIYKYNFSNLTDLYNYLIQDPEVNKKIFNQQASKDVNTSFAGESLEKSIEYLRGGYKVDFDKFDIAVKDVRKFGYEDIDSRKMQRSLHGGIYLSPLVAAGVPDCMIRYIQDSDPKHVTIYFQLSYPHYTTTEQVFNRGIATINLIQILEDKGYIVDLKVFELSTNSNEYIDITINLKQVDEFLNISKCYYPFVSKEFLRRLLFRLLESVPVKTDWNYGYGRSVEDEEIRNFYNLNSKDLVIGAPKTMGISGHDVFEDTVSLFEKLKLSEEFDLSKLKQKVKKKSIY